MIIVWALALFSGFVIGWTIRGIMYSRWLNKWIDSVNSGIDARKSLSNKD